MSSRIFKTPLPYIALLIAHLIWGINFVVAKVTLTEFPSMTLAFLRFAIASLLLAPFLYAETRKLTIDKKDLPEFILTGILIITFNITFFFEGLKRTSAINAAVLTMTIPILSVITGVVFLKEKTNLFNLLGIILSLIGALIIAQVPQFFLGNFATKEVLGNILIILACISWVFGSLTAKRLLKKYPSIIVTAIAFIVGTITFLLPAGSEYLENPAWPLHISIVGLSGLIFMTLLSSISAYFLFEWGLARTSVGIADLFYYIEPFITAGFAILLLSENLTLAFLLGAIFIVAGIYLGTLSQAPHHRNHKLHRN